MKTKQLRVKLKGFESFKETIKAIQMVAASDLKELKDELGERFEFLNAFVHFLEENEESGENEGDEDVNEEIETGKVASLVFPVTIDKNCCGPHNFNIFDATNSLLDTLTEESVEFALFAAGPRATVYFKSKYPKKRMFFLGKYDLDDLSLLLTRSLAERLVQIKDISNYIIVFNRFVTVFKTVCSSYDIPNFGDFVSGLNDMISTYLSPLSISVLKHGRTDLHEVYLYCISMILLDALHENQYTAVSGRIGSMTEAFKNIKKVIYETFLAYNKARQESITNEIIEVGVHMLI